MDREIALVTGGSSGIGLATAELLLQRGATVVIGARNEQRGASAVSRLREEGRRVGFIAMDVRNPGQVEHAFRQLDSEYGPLSILVNNAGVNAIGPIDRIGVDVWDDCLDTNLRGAFLCIREAVPRMRSRGGGSIISVASNAGLIARAADPVYCASKAGLVMLTRCIALAHARDRIRANVVCPGPVAETGMIDRLVAAAPDPAIETQVLIGASPMAAALGRMITPKEVAECVVYLCSDVAAMITGAALAIDGGKSAGIPQ